MAIPIKYNIRHLVLRRGLTAMTALGITMTVMAAVFIMMLLTGLNDVLVTSGSPLNVLVFRKGANSELAGGFPASSFPILRELPGVGKDNNGDPLVSAECMVVVVLNRNAGSGTANVTLRGMMPAGLKLRPNVKLVSGRWFTPGTEELVVGRSIRDRFKNASLGSELNLGKGQWTIVGEFESNGSAYESEIWGDVNQVAGAFNRTGIYNSVYMRAVDADGAEILKRRISDDQRIELNSQLESEYYEKQTKSGGGIGGIRLAGVLIAIIMGLGATFAAANTMYTSVANRAREIATLRIIGFRKRSIVISFALESILLAPLGATIAILAMLPFNGMTAGTRNNVTFSEVAFSLTMGRQVITRAFLFAVAIGLVGGVAPAWGAARSEIIHSLRR
jgi:putative ABC transport system permease protein